MMGPETRTCPPNHSDRSSGRSLLHSTSEPPAAKATQLIRLCESDVALGRFAAWAAQRRTCFTACHFPINLEQARKRVHPAAQLLWGCNVCTAEGVAGACGCSTEGTAPELRACFGKVLHLALVQLAVGIVKPDHRQRHTARTDMCRILRGFALLPLVPDQLWQAVNLHILQSLSKTLNTSSLCKGLACRLNSVFRSQSSNLLQLT